jgi:hypothetical protein
VTCLRQQALKQPRVAALEVHGRDTLEGPGGGVEAQLAAGAVHVANQQRDFASRLTRQVRACLVEALIATLQIQERLHESLTHVEQLWLRQVVQRRQAELGLDVRATR